MNLSRRGFLSGLLAVAAAEAIPFNRVWFLPKNILVPKTITATVAEYTDWINYADARLASIYYDKILLDDLKQNTLYRNMIQDKPIRANEGKQIQFYKYSL